MATDPREEPADGEQLLAFMAKLAEHGNVSVLLPTLIGPKGLPVFCCHPVGKRMSSLRHPDKGVRTWALAAYMHIAHRASEKELAKYQGRGSTED
jgi:hypothetical protein